MSVITVGMLEDELPQAQLVRGWLEEEGFSVLHSATGAEFLTQVNENSCDLLILDWQLPDCEGIDILEQLRNDQRFAGPVVFATAKDSEEDIVRGLTSGADDYIIKPLRRAELVARLHALWRRSGGEKSDELSLGPAVLDTVNCRAFLDGQEVKLTPTEFNLAVCLFSQVGKLLSREYLLREVWGVEATLDTRTVDMHISRIRKLLKVGPHMGYCIKTVYRHGYRLEAL